MSKKILIVDDEPRITLALQYLFEEDYYIIKAEDMKEALNLAKEKQPDLIILDIKLPNNEESAGILDGKGGIKVCQKLKDNPKTSHIPIIILTARGEDDNEYKALKAGANEYFTKPFNSDELIEKVADLLEKYEKAKANL